MGGLDLVVAYGSKSKPELRMESAVQYGRQCKSALESITSLTSITTIIDAIGRVQAAPSQLGSDLKALDEVISKIPEPTKQDSAREWLTVAQERLETLRSARRKQKIAEDDATLARTVSDTYAATSDSVLIGLYAAVEGQFAELYRFINSEDEGRFNARLVPSLGRLGFDVDFYGRGFFCRVTTARGIRMLWDFAFSSR